MLALVGTAPFIAFTTVLELGPTEYHVFAIQAIISYAAVTLSFLGGIQWGIGVSITGSAPHSAQTLFVLSIVPAMLGWALLFVTQANASVLVAIFLFGFAWVVDALLCLQKLIPVWFFRLRCIVSAVVVTSMIFVAIRL